MFNKSNHMFILLTLFVNYFLINDRQLKSFESYSEL